jgi:hypothetical protein
MYEAKLYTCVSNSIALGPEGSSPHLQESATDPYPEPVEAPPRPQSSSHPPVYDSVFWVVSFLHAFPPKFCTCLSFCILVKITLLNLNKLLSGERMGLIDGESRRNSLRLQESQPKSLAIEVLSSQSKVSVSVDGTTVSRWRAVILESSWHITRHKL